MTGADGPIRADVMVIWSISRSDRNELTEKGFAQGIDSGAISYRSGVTT